MTPSESTRANRRTFLRAGAVSSIAALSECSASQAQDAPAKATIPTRKLGKTGVDVTMLDQGAVRGSSVDRVLRYAYSSGIRVFDTAKLYGTEKNFKSWFEQMPEVRKQIFLITKDQPRTPKDMLKMVDERLAAIGTDYIDLFFIHGLGDDHKLDVVLDMLKGKELRETSEALKKSGKIKFIGFSSHHKNRAQIMQAAAEGGIVDAMMVQYSPWLEKDSPLNKAIDACHDKGIGLISMKQVAGKNAFYGDRPEENTIDKVKRLMPDLAERKLSPHQGLLHAIWSDERISSVCISMRNTDQIRENTDAARRFEPLKAAEIRALRDAAIAGGQTLCADCDGRCMAAAGTKAELGDLTRFLTYHQHHGDRAEARRQYANLPAEARDWTGADLEAARAACPNHLNFAKLLPKVDEYLA